MEWNSTLYDKKHDFVAEYGKGLLEFVPKNDGQAILDLGCGMGTLTVRLADLCHKVAGVDSSQSMIKKAKKQFGNIEFMVCDALTLPFENEFDVVFSNAVFHWLSDHDTLLKNIHKVFKPQGLLVCGFGARGNIAAIEHAFTKACNDMGYEYEPKFNFSTAEDFGNLLGKNGFVTDRIYDYDRPTVLKNGEQGLVNWMKQFYASELIAMPEKVQAMICKKVEELTRGTLWNGEEWVADYKVNPCIGCNSCFSREGNQCFQKDDMVKIYEKLKSADMVVIASPVYFYGISAELKAVVDRLHTPMRNEFKVKRLALLLVGAADLPVQITENQNELTSLEYRTKTSESGFGLEIYNIGQTPIFIDYIRLYYRKIIITDCFITGLKLMPYEKNTYNLMMQDYDAILYHRKKLKIKKCKVIAYDVAGKRVKGELDISWLQEPFCGVE